MPAGKAFFKSTNKPDMSFRINRMKIRLVPLYCRFEGLSLEAGEPCGPGASVEGGLWDKAGMWLGIKRLLYSGPAPIADLKTPKAYRREGRDR
jgi:hypothetical protein